MRTARIDDVSRVFGTKSAKGKDNSGGGFLVSLMVWFCLTFRPLTSFRLGFCTRDSHELDPMTANQRA
jgi:hypothetical protein